MASLSEPLSSEQRLALKRAIDARRRAAMRSGPAKEPRCSGCGCAYDMYNDGCYTCAMRFRNRRKRGAKH